MHARMDPAALWQAGAASVSLGVLNVFLFFPAIFSGGERE